MEEQRNEKAMRYIEKTNSKMTDINAALSVIMLSVNGLITPIKRKRLVD